MTLPPSPAVEPHPRVPGRARLGAAALLAGAWARLAGRSGRADELAMARAAARDGPPDLDELWRDFNRKLSGLFGGKGGGPRRGNGGDPNGGPNFQPNMRSAGVGAA